MTRNEILIAIQLLHAQIENSVMTEEQSRSRLGELIVATELLRMDDILADELFLVRSLMGLKRHQKGPRPS